MAVKLKCPSKDVREIKTRVEKLLEKIGVPPQGHVEQMQYSYLQQLLSPLDRIIEMTKNAEG